MYDTFSQLFVVLFTVVYSGIFVVMVAGALKPSVLRKANVLASILAWTRRIAARSGDDELRQLRKVPFVFGKAQRVLTTFGPRRFAPNLKLRLQPALATSVRDRS